MDKQSPTYTQISALRILPTVPHHLSSFHSAFYRQPTDSHASLTLECEIFYTAFSRFRLVNVAHSHIRHTTDTVIKHFTGPAVGRAAF